MLPSDIPLLFVERISDQNIYKSIFRTKILPVGGKEKVVYAIESQKTDSSKKRCRAIVDRDYDFFINQVLKSEQFVYTDAHSLETLLWQTDTGNLLSCVLSSYMGNISIDLSELRSKAFDIAYQTGLCRLINELNAWGISQYIMLDFEMFDSVSNEFLINEYIRKMLLGTAKKHLYYDYCDAVEDYRDRKYSQWEIMQGHDIAKAFIYLINQECDANEIKHFERETRKSKGCCNLGKSNMYQTIKKWEDALRKVETPAV